VTAERKEGGYGSRQAERRPVEAREPREERATYGRGERPRNDDLGPKVVGFGSDTPAFLQRAPRAVEAEAAAPAPPARRRRTTKKPPEEPLAEAS
jgi:hypothetical protein